MRKVHLVADNLNAHLPSSFEEVLGAEVAASILSRIEFHYTPTHASWLNMAEIEIGILERQCLARCAADPRALAGDRGLAEWTKCRSMRYRVDVHPQGRWSEARSRLFRK